ncbi:MAG: hypothetical protein KAX44_02945 [Candidatus Brocadiae bacterium]|nr:hypothetical protein [Candidatus Brocadiia bacterium]
MKRLSVVLALCALGLSAAHAGETPPPDAERDLPPATILVLHPAPEAVLALKHRLLPGLLDRQDGNAAVQYTRAALMMSERSDEQLKAIDELRNVPAQDLDREKARAVLALFQDALQKMELAARRKRCDWDLDLSQGFALLMQDLMYYRQLARLLRIQARLEIAEADYEQALHTLQTGFAMAQHVGEAPTLIHALVGMALADIMLGSVEELIQAPGAPNLYWALTALPRPLVSARKGIETELDVLALTYPELRDPESSHLGAAGWRALTEQVLILAGADHGSKKELAPTLAALATYTDAKRHLLEKGRPPEEVEAMPVLHVVAIYMMDGFRRLRDQHFKWHYVPYWQAQKGFDGAEARLQEGRKTTDAFLAALLLPALRRAGFQIVKIDRRVAALRCVEAVRLYAASHNGELPRSLDDVTQVPIPLNPATNEPFDYRVFADKAVLWAPVDPQESAERALRYELSIAR